MQKGISGKIASMFLTSKLSLLLMIALLIVGLYSASLIPREEEPQINVPMVDVMIGYPGASPKEVERRVVEPLEKVLSNIKGVEHLHSTADNGQAMIIVQFYVGEDVERSYVKLYDEIIKNMDKMPEGIHPPMIKTRSIDDVPVLGLTLWSEEYNDFELRQLTEELTGEIKKIKDVSTTNLIGGRTRALKVVLDKAKMAENGVDALSIMEIIKAANSSSQSGSFVQHNQEYLITTGEFLASKEDVENLIVGVNNNMPVYLHQVAQVQDGPATNADYVSFGYSQFNQDYAEYPSEYNAVTLSIAKVQGADAMQIADKVLAKVEDLKKELIPSTVHVEVTRNYGETASEKVSELFSSLFIAIMVVTGLVMLAMGWRGGLVVFLSVPLTFALTLASYYLLGYTLNRITLFALVFVVGIVVDDSIIIAENMHRHFKMRRLPFKDAALYAINEVGNPTILATFIVIASIFPMAFVSGMMGPYMSPMPIGASIAMLLSLLIALTITPYLGYHLLRVKKKEEVKKDEAEKTSWIYRFFDKYQRPLLESPKRRTVLFIGVVLLLGGALSLFYTKSVAVKMLPFDNKNEFQVVIDMPEGTTLEETSAVTREISHYLTTVSDVVNYQSYVGTSAPITFNGLVRHYDLRGGSHMADIQVNLLSKDDRKLQSHDIAKNVRPGIQEIATKYGANVKVVEVPPGPPVLSTLVAEVYGPDYEEQIKVAEEVKSILENTEDVVDIDWSVEEEQTEYRLEIDREKAMLYGIVPEQIVGNITYLLREQPVSNLYDENS
ncbi:MAG TPA: efflux RND transporter permease subunit, partial [Flavobacteriaceae bacterium]|nr:efflux RND transporter permease subunit [Flavobacteriaceae bacterium]